MTALYCVLSLLVGFLAGIALDDALDLYRHSRKAKDMKANVHPPSSRTLWAVALAAVVAAQLIVGGMLIKSRLDLQNAERDRASYQACTNRWQQEFASAYLARLTASTDASAALERVIRGVDTEDIVRIRVAVDEYLELRAQQVKSQQRNPYPALPDDLCGETP